MEFPLRRLEKYWMSYLRLINAAYNSRPLNAAKSDVEEFFVKRNMDKKIKDDAYEIEGSLSHPVKGDFRFQGLWNYIEYKTGQQS